MIFPGQNGCLITGWININGAFLRVPENGQTRFIRSLGLLKRFPMASQMVKRLPD